jgi:hypothetical protein
VVAEDRQVAGEAVALSLGRLALADLLGDLVEVGVPALTVLRASVKAV